MIHGINNDYLLKSHKLIHDENGYVMFFLRGANWIFKASLEKALSLSPCGGGLEYLHRSP
jgi:hypothetical protein